MKKPMLSGANKVIYCKNNTKHKYVSRKCRVLLFNTGSICSVKYVQKLAINQRTQNVKCFRLHF